ncbi:cytochrome P450 [Streptomyces sp. SID10853]|uniref:cytochrome P450 n=1 Tax=Streptomyces sp. SID10853 TaxID=2706028 RepID=UPI0013BF32F8|nr:cytochrome P450 [Streptomyces sp. SID10853]NDZ82993.1 cytochrome P450 [Streptomyces sp. SID10853]
MNISGTDRRARTTVFTPRIDDLLRRYRSADAFRLDPGTVGVAGPELIDEILRSRPANEFERPTFKPLKGRSITRPESSALMRAISQDVKNALKKPDHEGVDLSGEWPQAGHNYLRDLVFGADPFRYRVLVDRRLEWTTALTWTVIGTGAGLPGGPGPDAPVSRLAALTAAAGTYAERRHAMGMYRRAAAPICFTVSTLVANALWLGSPFDDAMSNRDILLETLRLLPPSWNLLRVASPEFAALDDRIGERDDVLMLPLLTHRSPEIWEDPDTFRPERWAGADPDNHPGYLPFGHANERCWGRHMVMPLAERLLDLLRADQLAVAPEQTTARVPLAGLLGVTGVRVTRQ